MRKNLVFTPLMVALVSGGALCAQDMSSAAMAGRVTSQDGQPLQGVRVILESPTLLGQRQATTDANGQFRIPILPGGEYTVTYTRDGYITRRLTVRLVAGQTGNANARMTSISVQEEVVEIVASAVAQIDKTDTIVASTFSREQLDKITGRSINSAAQLAPGLNTTNLESGTIYLRGGSGNSLKTYVNGGAASQGWGGEAAMGRSMTMGDLIESIAIIQSPVNARYGNTDGGMVSVVTSKGSNTYTGVLRVMGIQRNMSGANTNGGWSTADQGYPNREGFITPLGSSLQVGGTDILGKRYEVTVQGPLWKDRLTFSYGARLTPTTVSPQFQGGIWSFDPATNQNTGISTDRVGTFYRAPNGDTIRRPELYTRNDYNTAWYNLTSKSTYNQFGAFLQVTPQHQVEYTYTQYETEQTNNIGLNQHEPWDVRGDADRLWNLAYKGIIGNSGVLDIHYGKTEYVWYYAGFRGYNEPLIRTRSFASRIPINPNLSDPHALNSFDNYHVNGLLDWAVDSGSQFPGGWNPEAGGIMTTFNGQPRDAYNGGGTTTLSFNYQHHLDTKLGSHMIDVGYNSEKFQWRMDHGVDQNAQEFQIPGQIAYGLTDRDIYNPNTPNGQGIGAASAYAGQFIVFNTRTARYSDVDLYAVGKYGIGDAPFFQSINANNIGVMGNYFGNAMPSVTLIYGEGGVDRYAKTDMISYYVNDLWTLNDHHSVMLGLRMDNFKVYQGAKEIHSYSQPTFRFEYKWDIHGDQARVVNVSWAQFHNNIPAGGYFPMFTPPAPNQVTRYWDQPGGSSRPYLVGIEELLRLENYSVSSPPSVRGENLAYVASDFKAPISTELAVGIRRNLSVGGYWKATIINRTWKNDYAFYPGNVIVNNIGSTDIERVMKNTEGYERNYKALELEWDIPITKRVNFGGSYTYSRFTNNTPSNAMDNSAWWDLRDSYRLNIDWWWDQQTGSREAWRPTMVTQPEHFFKFYVLFDLSRGKLTSSLSFRGAYTSGGFVSDYHRIMYGLPYGSFPQIMTDAVGTNAPGSSTSYMFEPFAWDGFNVRQYVNTNGTGQDSWNLQARYTLNVPIVDRFAWLVTITIDNPFNHRGKSGWGAPSGSSAFQIYPNQLYRADGSPVATNLNPDQGIWKPNGNWNGLYQGRQGGRAVWLETGLRF